MHILVASGRVEYRLTLVMHAAQSHAITGQEWDHNNLERPIESRYLTITVIDVESIIASSE